MMICFSKFRVTANGFCQNAYYRIPSVPKKRFPAHEFLNFFQRRTLLGPPPVNQSFKVSDLAVVNYLNIYYRLKVF